MSNAKQLVAIASVVSVALVGCVPDQYGIHDAKETGTLLDAPALREHPLREIREQCGAPGAVAASLSRHPYLQLVSSNGARVMWTSTAAEPETLVLLGEQERTIAGAVDDTRYLGDGTRQLTAALDGLEPGTIQCYELRDASGERVYGPSGFRTAPSATTDDRIDVVLFGDSGWGSTDQAAVAAQLATVPIDLMVHVGDVAYTNGSLHELEVNHFAMYRELMGALPFFPTIGDHDDATDGAGPYREVFALPEMGGERYYSFDWGPLHVVVLDSVGDNDEQLAWAEQDLSASTAPWKIAVVSEPPYSSGFHGSAVAIRARYSSLFAQHGVQAVFSGDDHDYERSTPQDGVTYFVTGGGGRSVRPITGTEFTAFCQEVFHFLYLTIEDGVMRVRAIDATGREFDGVEFRQP